MNVTCLEVSVLDVRCDVWADDGIAQRLGVMFVVRELERGGIELTRLTLLA